MAYESCSFHSEPTTNHAQEMEEENAYCNIEVQHRPPSEPQHFVPVANREKSKSFIFVAVISVALFVILGMAVGGIVLVLQEKSKLDETKKLYEADVAELREQNQNLSKSFLEKLESEIKESTHNLEQVIQSQASKQIQINNNLERLIQHNEMKQNRTHVELLRSLAGATSCAELRDEYGVSESGIYKTRQSGYNHPVYNYCDFQLRTGNYACKDLLNKLGNQFEAGYFWIRENQTAQPGFKYCFNGASSCKELVQILRPKSDGIYYIYSAFFLQSIKLYCNGDGWTVFQRRKDGSVDFYRDWDDYVKGFGDMNGEFWLGLEIIYQLTKNGDYELRVDLEDFYGNKAYAEYGKFSISSASDKYRLNVSSYSGNAGDSLDYSSGQQFATKDSGGNYCATTYKGGWWYRNCHYAHLNGQYNSAVGIGHGGVFWRTWKAQDEYLKFAEMKFRKKT